MQRWLGGSPVVLIAVAAFEKGPTGKKIPRVVAVSFPLDSRGAILKPIRNTLGGSDVVVDTGFFGYNERMKAAASARTAASWHSEIQEASGGFHSRSDTA